MTPKEKAAFAKATDETRKRQALERQLAELQAKMTPQAPAEPPKPFWDAPEEALARQKQEIQNLVVGTRLQTSESIARSGYKDCDEKIEIFKELVMTVPGLGHQMLAASDPAEFAYRTAANHKTLQEAGNLDAMKEQIVKETETKVRAQIEKELKAKAEALEKERAALPGSLTNTPSKGVNRPTWGGPTSMNDILKGR